MIVGRIDEFGRALLLLSMRATPNAASQTIEVWVDTGFTGELVLSELLVRATTAEANFRSGLRSRSNSSDSPL